MKRFLKLISLSLALAAGCDGEREDADGDAGLAIPNLDTVTVETAAQAAELTGELHANLVITGGDLAGDLVFPGLTKVDGSLSVTYTKNLRTVSFTALQAVGAELLAESNVALTALIVDKLESVQASTLRRNLALTSFSSPALRDVGGVWVYDNPVLERLQFPLARFSWAENDRPGVLDVEDNLSLQSVSAPGAQRLTDVVSIGNSVLTEIDLAEVTEIGFLIVGDGLLQRLTFPKLARLGNPESSVGSLVSSVSLIALDMPMLARIDGKLEINRGALTSLSLPSLVSADGLRVSIGSLRRFEAPKLERVTTELGIRSLRMQSILLPALRDGCNQALANSGIMGSFGLIPDCAAEAVAPLCPVEELHVLVGCTCDPGGDLSKAVCPGADSGPDQVTEPP